MFNNKMLEILFFFFFVYLSLDNFSIKYIDKSDKSQFFYQKTFFSFTFYD